MIETLQIFQTCGYFWVTGGTLNGKFCENSISENQEQHPHKYWHDLIVNSERLANIHQKPLENGLARVFVCGFNSLIHETLFQINLSIFVGVLLFQFNRQFSALEEFKNRWLSIDWNGNSQLILLFRTAVNSEIRISIRRRGCKVGVNIEFVEQEQSDPWNPEKCIYRVRTVVCIIHLPTRR